LANDIGILPQQRHHICKRVFDAAPVGFGVQDLIPKDQHIPPHRFHGFRKGRNRIPERLCDLFINAPQFGQKLSYADALPATH
jgi:hypothetical protein